MKASYGTLTEYAEDAQGFQDVLDINFIENGKTFAVIPWQMALVARVLRALPNWIYDRLFAGAPHKPRRR